MFAVTFKVTIGGVNEPIPAGRNGADQKINATANDTVRSTCIGHLGGSFVVFSIKRHIWKGAQLIPQPNKLLPILDA